MKKYFYISLVLYLSFGVGGVAAHEGELESTEKENKHGLPEKIPVPNGFQPEGVVLVRGANALVGFLLSESIYQVNLRSGKGQLLVENLDGAIVGMAYDRRSNYLFTAAGPLGTVSVFNAFNGDKIAQFKPESDPGFINDGIVTSDAVYFTDSFVPVIYRISLQPRGRLPKTQIMQDIMLSGDFEFIPGGCLIAMVSKLIMGKRDI